MLKIIVEAPNNPARVGSKTVEAGSKKGCMGEIAGSL